MKYIGRSHSDQGGVFSDPDKYTVMEKKSRKRNHIPGRGSALPNKISECRKIVFCTLICITAICFFSTNATVPVDNKLLSEVLLCTHCFPFSIHTEA